MSPRQFHWLEKFSVQITLVASLVAGYFLLYPMVRASDGRMAVAFLAVGGPDGEAVFAGGLDRAVVFAAGLIVLSIGCGLLTFSSRPSGTILAVVLGAGAVAMRSPEFRTLLWLRQDSFGSLFRLLIVETMLLAVSLGVAVLVMGWVRALASKAVPRLAWRPLDAGTASGRPQKTASLAGGLGPWGRSVVSAALALLLGLAAFAVLLQSARRGQVLFALLVSFAVAAWLAQRLLPAPRVEAYLLAPLVAAVVLYALASVASYGPRVEAWAAVPLYARVLPLDWLTAGCGGAMLGCWVGQRMQEAKLMDRLEEQQKGD